MFLTAKKFKPFQFLRYHCHFKRQRCLLWVAVRWPLVLLAVVLFTAGCSRDTSSRTDAPPGTAAVQNQGYRVFAQGLIMPSEGIIQLFAAPSDILVELPFSVGSQVEAGNVLAIMQSESSIRARREALIEQKAVAEAEHATTVRQAELQRTAARLKVQQIQEKAGALEDHLALIRMGESQLVVARSILDRLKAISADSLTSEFVGPIEIDRQRIAVGEAEIKLEEQKTEYRLRRLETEIALKVAQEELEAAEEQLMSLRRLEPGKLFDLQLESLQTEAARSVLTAPTDGIILAVGAAPGGAATQMPLIEMANMQRLVCEAEVNVVDVGRIQLGNKAVITSRALPQPLTGTVIEKGRLVGRPRLRSPDPLAAADYRTLSVILEIEQSSVAADWIQLQVDVVFELSEVR